MFWTGRIFWHLAPIAYAVYAINIGESSIPFILAILTPALFALILGAVIFYGRLSDVYLGVITLVVTLILFRFASATAGPEYAIGKARLGGFNGMPNFQTLNIPGMPESLYLGYGFLLFMFLLL